MNTPHHLFKPNSSFNSLHLFLLALFLLWMPFENEAAYTFSMTSNISPMNINNEIVYQIPVGERLELTLRLATDNGGDMLNVDLQPFPATVALPGATWTGNVPIFAEERQETLEWETNFSDLGLRETIRFIGSTSQGNDTIFAIVEVIQGLEINCPENIIVQPSSPGGAYISWPDPTVTTPCSIGTNNCGLINLNGFRYLGRFGNSKYFQSFSKFRWEDAKIACEAEGGHLAVLENEAENDYLAERISEMTHIGLSDIDYEGSFNWVDFSTFSYYNWDPIYSGNNEVNNYAVLQNWDGRWSLVNFWVAKHFLLEIPCESDIEINQNEGLISGTLFPPDTTITIIYEAEDRCQNVVICSFTISVLDTGLVSTPPLSYCNSTSLFPWHEWISRVKIDGIEKVSGKSDYSDYTSITAGALVKDTIPVELTSTFSYTAYDEFWNVWIDYNRDSSFNDTNELVFSKQVAAPADGRNTTSKTVGSIIIPDNTSPGLVRMRVSMQRGGFPEPCETISFGEVEDYTFLIGTVSDGRPSPMIFTLDVSQANGSAALSWDIDSAEEEDSFFIERSTDGIQFKVLQQVSDLGKIETAHHYQLFDATPIKGHNYYRIRQTSVQGQSRYSPIGFLDFKVSGELEVFPNPAKEYIILYLEKFIHQSITIDIYNQLGHLVFQENINELAIPIFKIDLSSFQSGSYFAHIRSVNGLRNSLKFIVTKD